MLAPSFQSQLSALRDSITECLYYHVMQNNGRVQLYYSQSSGEDAETYITDLVVEGGMLYFIDNWDMKSLVTEWLSLSLMVIILWDIEMGYYYKHDDG